MKEISLWENDKTIPDIGELIELRPGEKSHFFYKMVEGLQREKPTRLVIWGTYSNALKCRDYLRKTYRIEVDACVINEKYMSLSVNRVNYDAGFPLISVEEWFSGHEDTDVIVDFSFFRLELIEKYKSKVRNLYVGDIMSLFIFDYPYTFTGKMLEEHAEAIKTAYDSLCDATSKDEYIDFLMQKIYGFYNKRHHNVQYFDEDVVRLSEHEIFVDCGAYDGDSVRSFLKYAHGKYDGIFAYEMDETNYKKLRENCAELERCECVNSGIGARKEQLKAFVGENASSHIAEEGNGTIQIDRIDDLVSYPVTFIKMDIEGYELDALKGARETICKYKPKLAICMYHKPEDLWEIPAFIKHLNPDYKLYFRNYHNSGSESVLYAL